MASGEFTGSTLGGDGRHKSPITSCLFRGVKDDSKEMKAPLTALLEGASKVMCCNDNEKRGKGRRPEVSGLSPRSSGNALSITGTGTAEKRTTDLLLGAVAICIAPLISKPLGGLPSGEETV